MKENFESAQNPELNKSIHDRSCTVIKTKQNDEYTGSTEKVNYAEIKKPDNASFYIGSSFNDLLDETGKVQEEFSFEKNTLRILGEAKLAKFKEEGPSADVDLNNPKIASLQHERKLFLLAEKEQVQLWSTIIKILSVILIGAAIINSLFSIIYIFVMATNPYVNIVKNTIPLVINLVISIWMINISIKISNVSAIQFSSSTLFTAFFKLAIGTLIFLLIQLALMSNLESVPELLDRTKDLYLETKDQNANNRKGEAYTGLGYLIVWCNCIFNLASTGLGVLFAFILRRHLAYKEMIELEQKTLPIGYQIFDKLKNEIKSHNGTVSTSEPYKI